MDYEKVIRSLNLVSMQTRAIPSMCATFTNSLWEMDKWPIFVQIHSSYTAIFILKWQLFITYILWEHGSITHLPSASMIKIHSAYLQH